MLKRFGVVFEYSMAWLLPIAGLSFVIAWLKFRKLSKLPDISKGMALLISGLRFIVIFRGSKRRKRNLCWSWLRIILLL